MGSFMQKKSSFAERCNLLSQYLKERGSFGDICFDMNADNHASRQHPASATTMNLLPNLGNNSSDVNIPAFNSSTSIEDPSNRPEDFRMNKPDAATMEAEDHHGSTSKKMTIFYGGKVLVFDELSPEKVKEILALVAPTTPTTAATVNINNNSTRDSGDHNMNHYSGRPAVTPDLNVVASTSGEDEDNISINAIHSQENRRQRQHSQMRKASLHRFLEKRKDRVTGKAPYPVNNFPKPEKPNQWIQHEGQSSNHLELKL